MDTEINQETTVATVDQTTTPTRDWKKKMRYPPRRIAVNQNKMLIYHWPIPYLLFTTFVKVYLLYE